MVIISLTRGSSPMEIKSIHRDFEDFNYLYIGRALVWIRAIKDHYKKSRLIETIDQVNNNLNTILNSVKSETKMIKTASAENDTDGSPGHSQ
jgi:hypothetical protein